MKWNTRITEMLGICYPIIQGGLAYLAYSDLASAVSNAGGLGQITAMSLSSPSELREEIAKTREKTTYPFGVNYAIGMHGRPFEQMLQVAVDEGISAITVTGGNPAHIFKQLKGVDIKKLVLVGSKRQAMSAERLGADAVMVVGQEAGGRIGRSDMGTMVLVPQVIDAVSIPVVASGGIGDGRGVLASLALGAEGVEMGTAFITTEECVHAHQLYKQNIIEGEETVVISREIGAPARVIKNEWAGKILAAEKEMPTYENLKDYISGNANKRFIQDGRKDGHGYAGQIIARIQEIQSVSELINGIVRDTETMHEQISILLDEKSTVRQTGN